MSEPSQSIFNEIIIPEEVEYLTIFLATLVFSGQRGEEVASPGILPYVNVQEICMTAGYALSVRNARDITKLKHLMLIRCDLFEPGAYKILEQAICSRGRGWKFDQADDGEELCVEAALLIILDYIVQHPFTMLIVRAIALRKAAYRSGESIPDFSRLPTDIMKRIIPCLFHTGRSTLSDGTSVVHLIPPGDGVTWEV